MQWHLYILLCQNGKYYTGVTNDLRRRYKEHLTGRGGNYTKINSPVKLLCRESFPSRCQAEKREMQIKGRTRRKKQALIACYLKILKTL